MIALQAMDTNSRPLKGVNANPDAILEWALACMRDAPVEVPNPRRHSPTFLHLVLEASSAKDDDLRAWAKRYTLKDPAYTQTKQGLGAVAFEMAVVKAGGTLVDSFVETIIGESEVFQAVFIGKLKAQDLEKLERTLDGRVTYTPILEHGAIDPKTQLVNEFTVYDCTPKDVKQGQPTKDFQGFPATEREYSDVRESGGVPKSSLMYIHEWASITPEAMVDQHGVTWSPMGANFAPVNHAEVLHEVFEYAVKGQPENKASIGATLTKYRELGIKRIALSEFEDVSFKANFYASSDRKKIDALKVALKESHAVTPLIVVKDKEGYYVLEGAHRMVALSELGAKDLPALVVEDLDESGERTRHGITVRQEVVQHGPESLTMAVVTIGEAKYSVPVRSSEIMRHASRAALVEFVELRGSLIAPVGASLEEADKVSKEEEPEGDDRMGSPEFYREDMQAYYDALCLLGLDPEDCEKKTKAKFGITELTVTPTGEVRSPGIVDRPASQELPPGTGAEFAGGGAAPAAAEEPAPAVSNDPAASTSASTTTSKTSVKVVKEGLAEALSDQAAKDALTGGKAVLIDDCWWEIVSRDLEADKVVLAQSEYAIRDGFPKAGEKSMAFSTLASNIASGKWSANINGTWHGPKQDPAVRDKHRKAKGLPAAPGAAEIRNKDEAVMEAALVATLKSSAIGDALKKAGLDGNGRFKSVGAGLNALANVLDQFGLQQADVNSADLFKAKSGSRLLSLEWVNPKDPHSPVDAKEGGISFAWHELMPDKYEITAYATANFKKPILESAGLTESTRIRYTCPECGSTDVAIREAHADTGMDCMRGRCKGCDFSADLDDKKFIREEYEDPNYTSPLDKLKAGAGFLAAIGEAVDEDPPTTVSKICAAADKGPVEAKRIWKHATDAADEKFETGSDEWWMYAMGVVKKACAS